MEHSRRTVGSVVLAQAITWTHAVRGCAFAHLPFLRTADFERFPDLSSPDKCLEDSPTHLLAEGKNAEAGEARVHANGSGLALYAYVQEFTAGELRCHTA